MSEPKEEVIAEEENALVIMPGVAFDKSKNRIGRGKGYYDKYLSEHLCMNKIALGFDFQVLEEIPSDHFDIPPNMIITEKEIIH